MSQFDAILHEIGAMLHETEAMLLETEAMIFQAQPLLHEIEAMLNRSGALINGIGNALARTQVEGSQLNHGLPSQPAQDVGAAVAIERLEHQGPVNYEGVQMNGYMDYDSPGRSRESDDDWGGHLSWIDTPNASPPPPRSTPSPPPPSIASLQSPQSAYINPHQPQPISFRSSRPTNPHESHETISEISNSNGHQAANLPDNARGTLLLNPPSFNIGHHERRSHNIHVELPERIHLPVPNGFRAPQQAGLRNQNLASMLNHNFSTSDYESYDSRITYTPSQGPPLANLTLPRHENGSQNPSSASRPNQLPSIRDILPPSAFLEPPAYYNSNLQYRSMSFRSNRHPSAPHPEEHSNRLAPILNLGEQANNQAFTNNHPSTD